MMTNNFIFKASFFLHVCCLHVPVVFHIKANHVLVPKRVCVCLSVALGSILVFQCDFFLVRCVCCILVLPVCVCARVHVFSRVHKHCVSLGLSSAAQSQQATGDEMSLVVHNNHCDHSEAFMHYGN